MTGAVPPRHRQLLAMLKVGAVGFGGGSALIPVMERELVNDRGGLSTADFTRDTVIANLTPGALPVKLAALSGLRVRGSGTAAVSAVAVALPGTAATVALLAFFSTLGPGGIRVVEGLSLGVTAFILFLLAHYAHRVLRPDGAWRAGGVFIALAVFLATGADVTGRLVTDLLGVDRIALPQLSAVAVILLAVAVVGVVTLVRSGSARPAPSHRGERVGVPTRRALRAALLLALIAASAAGAAALALPTSSSFVALLALSTISSFGGGEAYVAVADGFFVAPGLVGSLDFYGQIVPVANALPGPILIKVAAGMGYSVGAAVGGPPAGVLLASCVMIVAIGVCAAIALALLAGYDAARRSRFVQVIALVILPVVCGLLASTAIAMLHASAVIAERNELPGAPVVAGTVVLAVLVGVLHHRVRAPDLAVIAGCAAVSLAAVLLVPEAPR